MSYLNEIPTYRKRTYKKKAPARVKKAPTRGKIYGAAAGQLYKDVQLLKSMINVEYKVVDSAYALATVSSTPTVFTYNPLVQGTDFTQRTGRSVKFTSLYHRITFQTNALATTPHFIRYILFIYKDPSGVAPTPLQMFGSATPGINAMMNLNLRKDFTILEDSIINMNTLAGGQSSQILNKYFKLDQHTIYNAGNAGTIADIESGAICAFMWSDTATAAELPYCNHQVRMRYIDN